MCGISGFLNYSGLPSNQVTLLKNMLARIQYRGPDESGIYYNDVIAFGSVRLSIIDISTGQQPLSTEHESLWIAFNGEIFNYIELKSDLVKADHKFQTESDTEVLLHAYLEYGTSCLEKLNGQFAFCIWDRTKNELFLARDRVGIRPLYYTWHDNTFVFGSEIKTIFEYPGIKAEIDNTALSQVFTFWSAISPKSVFRNIRELPPGHWMRLKEDGSCETRQYWSLKFPSTEQEYFKGTFTDACEELRTLLTDAVKIRLRSDVPVAAYLSGGLDSSATSALIKDVAPDILQTFSIGFEDSEFDETSFQQEVSNYLNTKHTAFYCTNNEIGQFFPEVIWHTETPILRSAPVPMFCLSRKVRENNIKVVITGEGADEMFAGYDIFKEAIIREFWSRQPDSKYRPLLLKKLYPYIEQFKGRNANLLKFFYGYKLDETGSPYYSHLLRWRNTANIINYFSEDIKASLDGYDPMKEVDTWLGTDFDSYDVLGKAQWLEISIFMSGYLLSSQGDRVSMANSVEGRYPFLDYRIIEFAATLPSSFKMHGLNEKYILKKLMDGKLPERVLKRPKQAYRAPISKSFFAGIPPMYVQELLSENLIKETGIFSVDNVSRLLNKLKGNQLITEVDNMALAGILSTQILYYQYITKSRFRPALKELTNCRKIINHSSK